MQELKKKKMITREVSYWKDEISAIWNDGQIYIVSSICPHFGGTFKYLEKKGVLRCNWHKWDFDVKTGKLMTYPLKTCLKHYSFNIVNAESIEVLNV